MSLVKTLLCFNTAFLAGLSLAPALLETQVWNLSTL